MTKELKIEDLNKLYDDADQADQEVFAEQRSNILLIMGDHYTKMGSRFYNRLRDVKDIQQEQKLRLTKNHIQKITKTYVNNILSHAPWVHCTPKNESELQDQKAAELCNSVWEDARVRHDLRLKIHSWAKDYIDCGEVAVKVFWNPHKGKLIGFKAQVDSEDIPIQDENGEYEKSSEPVFEGDLEIERLYTFNLLRDPGAKSMEDSPYLIIRKMVPIKEAKALVGNDEEKLKHIQESEDKTYMIFDGNRINYRKSKDQVMFKEYYFRPCFDYPEGYFFITVEGGVLFEGPLPFGVFPIIYQGFDEVQTSPRHRSIVKQLRPYQIEINRTASKIAETQQVFDDKLLIQSGTKITNGGQLPGIRAVQFSGMPPQILPGRSGEQYLGYMSAQISEMYSVANLMEDSEVKESGQMDSFAQLFRMIRDKKKFSGYGEKFELFLTKICSIYLELAKNYYSDDRLVACIGKNEYINISEFREADPLYYSIVVEPSTSDTESMLGKTVQINHILQYVGNQLSKEDIGKLIRAMPLANLEESFNDLTLDYDSATNFILALDRGEAPLPNKYDNAVYMIKRLTQRIRLSDFRQLHPQIQKNYDTYIRHYEKLEEENQRKIIAAKSEYIPTDGPKVKVDFYLEIDGKSQRATVPSSSLEWLLKRLADQGTSQETLQKLLSQGVIAEMAGDISQGMPTNGPESIPQLPEMAGGLQ